MKAKKRRASPAQLAARLKFAAMARAGKLARRGKRAVKRGARKLGRKSRAAGKAAVRAFRATNPSRRSYFQVAARKGNSVLFLSGIGLSSNREAASNYGTLSTARKIAGQVRDVGRKLGIGRVAVVTTHDSAGAIRKFLLGEA